MFVLEALSNWKIIFNFLLIYVSVVFEMHISMKSLSIHCCVHESDITLYIPDFCVGRAVRGEKDYPEHS